MTRKYGFKFKEIRREKGHILELMIDAKSEKKVEGTDQERVHKRDDQQNRISGVQECNMYESSD
jgi:predicted DNA-binding helix-hairpin-helix protein